MALGLNRQYNNFCGIPVPLTALTRGTSRELPPNRGAVVSLHGAAAVVETLPRTASNHPGLPTSTDAEEYILDLGPSIWQVNATASGSAISVGTVLSVCVAHENVAASRNAGDYQPGDVTNEAAVPNKVVAVEGLVARSSLDADTRGMIYVYVGAPAMTVT